ncbi:acyltransferase family protein [Polynucleobacter brandtiae]|uniref:Peptidoglycan/LPS O-acetylase OafA/YrhL n=1 Tax=Polynucleobacter brandtiae TaxID=1938816 RepID=A0A2M8VR29_9BURK|nr:acyltransferase family protein [Polynucleobacter brandtiae]PJI79925.1 peptidoglycan/LPS O-acetylase OafA/YrhL [Polynucleobacter brandtiae]
MTLPLHPKYRPDIDGLRAIAVLSVVIFHGFPHLLPGGFIGVDIFFVISGYLISTIIFQNIQNHTFSFADFYTRRIRRIFPALIVVLIFCHALGWFLLVPSEYQQLGKHIAGGSSFLSNLLLWRESGYFDASAESKPLLHLWSLGIEEQFYIVWPLILLLAYKARLHLIQVVVWMLGASFIVNLLLTSSDPISAFYLPLSRFWELLIGAVIAHTSIHHKEFISRLPLSRGVISTLGLVLIFVSMAVINKGSLFPGWWALLPTLGAAFIIVGGPQAWINQKLLAHPLLVWFGLISFPLYLWHWPIFTFYRLYSFHEVSAIAYVLLIALSILLAWCTFYFIERQFRHDKNPWKLSSLMIGLIAIGFIGWNCYDREGMPFRAIAQEKFNFKIEHAYGQTHCFSLLNQADRIICDKSVMQSGPNKPIFLWGDSHAAHLNAGLLAQLKEKSIALYDGSLPACPPILHFLPRQERSDATQANENCEQNNLRTFKEIKTYKPSTVILAADWLQYDGVNQFNLLTMRKIEETILSLRALGVNNIILIGNFPIFYIDQPRLASALFESNLKNRTFQRFNTESLEINKKLKDFAQESNITFVSPTDILCNSEGCLLSTSKKTLIPIGLDTSHLSKEGSIFFINQALLDNLIRFQ